MIDFIYLNFSTALDMALYEGFLVLPEKMGSVG